MAIEPGSSELRGAERRTANANSTVRGSGLQPFDALIHDISQTGIRFDSLAEFKPGDEVSVGLEGVGARSAVVAWRRVTTYGCEFVQPLQAIEVQRAFTGRTLVRLNAGLAGVAGPHAEAPAAPPIVAAAPDSRLIPREWLFVAIAIAALATATLMTWIR